MTITVTKKIEETKDEDLQLPAYFRGYKSYFMIKEDETLIDVRENSCLRILKPGDFLYNSYMTDAIACPSATESEVNVAIDAFLLNAACVLQRNIEFQTI